MEQQIQSEAMEKQLAEHFSNAGFTKDQLAKLSKYVAALRNAGITIHDIMPKGKPQINAAFIEGQMGADKLATLPGLLANRAFKELQLFRKGVPVPVFFQLKTLVEEL